jgi:hypothetical protein
LKWLLAWLFILSSFVQAQEIHWQTTTEKEWNFFINLFPSEMTLSESLHVELTAEYPSAFTLDEQLLKSNLLLHVNPFLPFWQLLEEKSTMLDSEKEGWNKQQFLFTLKPLAAGTLYLSFLQAAFISKQDSSLIETLSTPVFSIVVKETASLDFTQSIAPPLPLDHGTGVQLSLSNRQNFIDNPSLLQTEAARNQALMHPAYFIWLQIALVLMGAGWLAAYVFRQRRQKEPLPLPLDPAKESQRLLDHLRHSHLLEQNEYKTFYLSLEQILRHYLVQTQNLSAQTSSELLQHLSLDPLKKKTLQLFLEKIDLVKFAQAPPSLEECQQGFQVIQDLINANKK